jgi:ankyrin repeat protein
MNNEELPNLIGALAELGEFDRVKAWLAGGTASAPRSINAGDDTGWTILMWTARGASLEHLEFARYLISRGARVDVLSRWTDVTALHFACRRAGETTAANDMVSVLIAAGAPVNAHASGSGTPLFMIQNVRDQPLMW